MRLAPSPNRTPRVVQVFFVLAAVAFTCAYPFLAVVNNPNENVRTYTTIALVEDHTFRIDADGRPLRLGQ